MNVLLILSHPSHDIEGAHQGLRLASNLARDPAVHLRVFLTSDSVRCARRPDPSTPPGSPPAILAELAREGVLVAVFGPSMEKRGMQTDQLIRGATLASAAELDEWRRWADRVVGWVHAAEDPDAAPTGRPVEHRT